MSMDDLLKELQTEYVEGLPEKISEIESFLFNKNIEGLINSFHKLKGSGKTYGIDEVTVLGEFFETWMREDRKTVMVHVPVSIAILNRIYEARVQSAPYAIDADPEFKALLSLK